MRNRPTIQQVQKPQGKGEQGKPRNSSDWLRYLEEQKQAGLIRGFIAVEPPVVESPVKEKKKHKYGAVRTIVDGIQFDSAKEAARYVQLSQMEKEGKINDLRLQVPFVLIEPNGKERGCKYVADFAYTENGLPVVEDVKSVATRKTRGYIIKRKLMLSVHGIKVKEV